MFLDLFSGVDFFFFKFSVFQGSFVFLSFMSVFFWGYYSYYLKFSFGWGVKYLLGLITKSKLSNKGGELKGFLKFTWVFFIFMLFSNILGLMPYVYGKTTKFYLVLLFSLWGWLTMVLSSFVMEAKKFIAHFCPLGAPLALGGFLSMVEVVSVSIRPLTLTLRLVAKMTTGHMLVGLLTLSCCYLFFFKGLLSILCLVFLSFYVLFEVAICFVQGKVYFMLFQSYVSEHL